MAENNIHIDDVVVHAPILLIWQILLNLEHLN